MDKKVYKYPLNIVPPGSTMVELPRAAEFRHFACQDGVPTIWCEVDVSEARIEQVDVHVVGTGHHIPEGAGFLATCLDGPFVWHLYTRTQKQRRHLVTG